LLGENNPEKPVQPCENPPFPPPKKKTAALVELTRKLGGAANPGRQLCPPMVGSDPNRQMHGLTPIFFVYKWGFVGVIAH